MHESMMIAEVGDMVKVSGSRIATPFAPPSPGKTPMMTPSVMPISISTMLYGVSTTAKPLNSALSSSTSPSRKPGSETEQVLQRPLGQRDLEPDLEEN